MTSDVRAAAITLGALLEVDPKSELIDPLAAGLKAARKDTGEWGTTQENVWSLVALAQYAKRVTPGVTTATVTVGGKVVSKRTIKGGDVVSLRVPLGGVSGDDVQVAVDHAAHVSVRAALARVDDGKAQSNGYTVERTYLDASGGAMGKVKAGDIVTVQLVVNASDMHKWIALVDPLPAGFEALEAKLASGGADAMPSVTKDNSDPWGRWDVLWDHQDMHDDRVEWFADVMRSGRYTVTYRARATIAGTFFAAPAHVEAMYAPEVNGRSESTVVTVEK
jgi:alpha-2-macroglobulin